MSEQGPTIEPGAWARVLVVMERLAASSDLDEILRLVIDSMRDCLGADRASVFQYDRETDELFATEAHGVDRSLRFGADQGLAGEALRSGRIVNTPDCYADERFNRGIDERTGYRTRCLLTIPLVDFDGRAEGVAQVLNKQGASDASFDKADEAVARALASQAAVALRRARLIEAERRKNKIEADLRIAREIQRASLPRGCPEMAGYEIAASSRAAEETGGDTFELIASPGADGRERLLIFMADASGHGVGPAMSVAQAQAMMRVGASLGAGVGRLIERVNAALCERLPVGRFITAFAGLLEAESGRIEYVAAGQSPVVIVRAGGEAEILSANAMPLGLDDPMQPDAVDPVELGRGDVFVLLSDGIYERADERNDQLGVDRVVEAVRTGLAASAADILARVERAAESHAGGLAPTDDQTGVIVKRL